MKPAQAVAAMSLMFVTHIAVASQQAQTVTDTHLKAKPEPKASVVADLPSGSTLVVNERRGGWYAADSSLGKGWVRMLHVRLAGLATQPGKAGVGTLVTLGSMSRTDTTVATGIRGLTVEELQKARENPQELAKLNYYLSSDADARQFAAQGKVVSRTIGKEK